MKQICKNKGGIILFHDIQANTVQHLKSWIVAIKEQGHTFVGLEHFVPQLNTPFTRIKSTVKPTHCEPPKTNVIKQEDQKGFENLIEEINKDPLGNFIDNNGY
jgi:hypothetical protein